MLKIRGPCPAEWPNHVKPFADQAFRKAILLGGVNISDGSDKSATPGNQRDCQTDENQGWHGHCHRPCPKANPHWCWGTR